MRPHSCVQLTVVKHSNTHLKGVEGDQQEKRILAT